MRGWHKHKWRKAHAPSCSGLITHDSTNQYFSFKTKLIKSDREMVSRLTFQFKMFSGTKHCLIPCTRKTSSMGNTTEELTTSGKKKNNQMGNTIRIQLSWSPKEGRAIRSCGELYDPSLNILNGPDENLWFCPFIRPSILRGLTALSANYGAEKLPRLHYWEEREGKEDGKGGENPLRETQEACW